jgi:hypothetical protein
MPEPNRELRVRVNQIFFKINFGGFFDRKIFFFKFRINIKIINKSKLLVV